MQELNLYACGQGQLLGEGCRPQETGDATESRFLPGVRAGHLRFVLHHLGHHFLGVLHALVVHVLFHR